MVFHRHGSLTRDAVYGILANEDFRSLATLCFPSHAGFSSALARSPLPEVLLGSVLVVALDSRGVRSIGLALFGWGYPTMRLVRGFRLTRFALIRRGVQGEGLARLLRGSVVSVHFWAMRFSLGTVRTVHTGSTPIMARSV